MNTEADAPRVITIGGREWREITHANAEHDGWIMEYLARAGMDLKREDSETDEALVLRCWRQMVISGVLFDILGCVLIASDIIDAAWTHEESQKTAAFMRLVTDHEGKREINTCVVLLVMRFFGDALVSLPPSGVASTSPEEGERSREAIPAMSS